MKGRMGRELGDSHLAPRPTTAAGSTCRSAATRLGGLKPGIERGVPVPEKPSSAGALLPPPAA